MSKFQKQAVVYAITHFFISRWVLNDLRRQGKTEFEAQLGAHIAAAATGFLLTAII